MRSALQAFCFMLMVVLGVVPLPAQSSPVFVSLGRPFFNPSLGQEEPISIGLPGPGRVTVRILDRDGFLVSLLARNRAVPASRIALNWNGRDEQGRVVPDEAYSLKIDFADGRHHLTYFPSAMHQAPVRSIPVRYFDPRTGIVAYTLPYAARVHIQAGCARIGKGGEPDGPVLKTIVDREPRVAGEVLDHWNGFDESGAIYVPDLPHFVMSVAASPLPENAIITVGNRSVTFLDYVVHRQGISLVPQRAAGEHHVGLTTLDDISPPLSLSPVADWSAPEKAWIARNTPVRVRMRLGGPAASSFAEHSDAILVFVDGQQIDTRHSTASVTQVMLPRLSHGMHTVAVNWVGRDGPVAVNSFRLVAGRPAVSSR